MKTSGETICENCGKPEKEHRWKYGRQWCDYESFSFKPKPEPPTQLPKRPVRITCVWCNHFERGTYEVVWEAICKHSTACDKAPHIKQAAKIAELEKELIALREAEGHWRTSFAIVSKELRVMRRALENACAGHPTSIKYWIEAARKESKSE